MKTLGPVMNFVASVVFGCGAAIAIASTAALTEAAPVLLDTNPVKPVEAIRLDPVTVTISKARFDEIRATTTELARSTDARKVTRG